MGSKQRIVFHIFFFAHFTNTMDNSQDNPPKYLLIHHSDCKWIFDLHMPNVQRQSLEAEWRTGHGSATFLRQGPGRNSAGFADREVSVATPWLCWLYDNNTTTYSKERGDRVPIKLYLQRPKCEVHMIFSSHEIVFFFWFFFPQPVHKTIETILRVRAVWYKTTTGWLWPTGRREHGES